MIKTGSILFLLIFISLSITGQTDLYYYFEDDISFNSKISKPSDILDFEIGEKHVSHDQLVKYMHIIAEQSDRVKIERYGWTYEHRPLLLLTISSPENLSNIDRIREDHLKLSDPTISGEMSIDNMPSVIWLGYSVHGNEPSGLNASLLVAYYLAAAETDELNKFLDNAVILLDPSINPDGYSRFEQWVNQYMSDVSVSDPNNVEHNEAWPRGRTNHYWFDLNRDWLPLQHPESQARIKQFHKWKPNILTDHHEMGSNSTFFFQPGIPSRTNPNTPAENFSLTNKIAAYHAEALDKIGSLYFSKEQFDDFYYGKGSSYPDVNGSIGILFEQASSRGLAQQTVNGVLNFPFTIRNQVTVSLSTIKSGYELKNELLEYQADFYRQASELAGNEPVKAYVLDGGDDLTKTNRFLDILLQHQINTYRLAEDLSYDDHKYPANTSYIVPLEQEQFRLIKAIFERSTSFTDSLFYDVSAWTFPLAFDIEYTALEGNSFKNDLLGDKLIKIPELTGKVRAKSSYAYLMKLDDYNSYKALYMILKNNLKVKVALKSFSTREGSEHDPGTILIPVKNQSKTEDEVYDILKNISTKSNIDFSNVSTGFNQAGIDLGSPNMVNLEKPKVMMLVGDGVSSYEAGEVWHLLDNRFGIPLSMVEIDRFNRINLSRYNTIIMVSGDYSRISGSSREKLEQWIRNGGDIIGIKGGSKWLIDQKLANIKLKKTSRDTASIKNYGDMYQHLGAQNIGGSIFEAILDLSHPLCFGYPEKDISLFKNNKLFFEKSNNPYNNPVLYTEDPLQSGYISKRNYELVKNTSGLIVSSMGRGKTICFSDNPNFRAFWYGTNRLFLNAIFFGDIISNSSTR
jgi:hypothetical protein